MMLNLIVFLLIVLTTMYLATQGLLSALLALATSVFSSILAMALMEPLQFIVAGWRPEYARGVTFLVLFLLIFSGTRILADVLVPDNIKLSMWVNRICGGTIGFLTSLVVVGTILVGVQMLPLPRTLVGFDRFPEETAMQGEGQVGELTSKSQNIWFAPDRFVQVIWSGASGRGLGGNHSWAQIHPDLPVESYGYRNNAWKASLRTLPNDLFSVLAAWTSSEPKDLEALGIPASAGRGRVVLVRTQVIRGEKAPHTSNDPEDSYFRITPTQVRLLTNKDRQYYPAGYLEQGRKFHPLLLDRGALVEDYVSSRDGSRVVEDWVFLVGEDETPTLIEMKQFARAELASALKDRRPAPLSTNAYPPLAYQKELSTATVVFNTNGKKIESGKVYLVKSSMPQDDVIGEVSPAYDHVLNVQSWINENSHGWSREAKPGVPDSSFFQTASRFGQDIKTDKPDTEETWERVLPVLLAGQAEPEGERNLNIYSGFFDEHVVPMWKNAKKGSAARNAVDADASGKAVVDKIVTGEYTLVCTLKTDRGFYVWIQPTKFENAQNPTINLSTAGNGPAFKIDLDAVR